MKALKVAAGFLLVFVFSFVCAVVVASATGAEWGTAKCGDIVSAGMLLGAMAGALVASIVGTAR